MNPTSRCSGRNVNRVRLGASNETGPTLVLFVCDSSRRATLMGGSQADVRFVSNSTDEGPAPTQIDVNSN